MRLKQGIVEYRKYKKSLTIDQKEVRWKAFAQKTERQELMFRRVFNSVFEEQKKQVVAELNRTGGIPHELNDEKVARLFEPAIELVYRAAFEDAL